MNGRLLLAMFIAVVPISVEMGAGDDSTRHRPVDSRPHEHETRLNAGLSGGQFAIIRRGCNGEVVDVAKHRLQSGALEVEHVFPNDLVIGVRGGNVSTRAGSFTDEYFVPEPPHAWIDNAYVNPYLGVDDRHVSFALGYLRAEHPFPRGENRPLEVPMTGHVLWREPKAWAGVRFMEDLPLESKGYLTVESGRRLGEHVDATLFLGLVGPFDGALLGLEGRVWFTREAALMVRGGLGGQGQHTIGVGLETRLGRH